MLTRVVIAPDVTSGWSTGKRAAFSQSGKPIKRSNPIIIEANMSRPGDGSGTAVRPSIPGSSVPGGRVATIGSAPASRSTLKQDSRNVFPSGSSAHAFGFPKRLPSPPARISPANTSTPQQFFARQTQRKDAKAQRRKENQSSSDSPSSRPFTTRRIPWLTSPFPKFTTSASLRSRRRRYVKACASKTEL